MWDLCLLTKCELWNLPTSLSRFPTSVYFFRFIKGQQATSASAVVYPFLTGLGEQPELSNLLLSCHFLSSSDTFFSSIYWNIKIPHVPPPWLPGSPNSPRDRKNIVKWNLLFLMYLHYDTFTWYTWSLYESALRWWGMKTQRWGAVTGYQWWTAECSLLWQCCGKCGSLWKF